MSEKVVSWLDYGYHDWLTIVLRKRLGEVLNNPSTNRFVNCYMIGLDNGMKCLDDDLLGHWRICFVFLD